MKRNIAVIGIGYVGLVTGLCLADLGFRVIFTDLDERKVELVLRGLSPIYEPGVQEKLAKHGSAGNIEATTDTVEAVTKSSVSFITVGTNNVDGEIDLSGVKGAAKDIGAGITERNDYHVAVVKSTVIPGTTDELVIPTIEAASGKVEGEDFGVCVNPEFLREGSAIRDFMNPDRIVVGYRDERACRVVEEVFSGIKSIIVKTDLRTAEMIKYANNAFLATKISFINEIANICELFGVDVTQVAYAIGLDFRINPEFLRAGCGFGGSCFPKDLRALISTARKKNYSPVLLEATLKVNDKQPLRMIELAKSVLGELRGRRVAVLGLAFKPETDDMREAPSIKIVQDLLKQGAVVAVHDPKAMERARAIFGENVEYAKSSLDALRGADCCSIVTEWREYAELPLEEAKKTMRVPLLVDGRRVIDPVKAADVGFIYRGIGYGKVIQ
ncbi:MAG: UDP-glucose/GDP-mannose dehydrogenase family protein [Candidatus Freyarchaeota archaeon]|nr:UDP-glucose/GDP-mannose dehydrogenase family protein [Candidatus Jordarchaeia archaeon]